MLSARTEEVAGDGLNPAQRESIRAVLSRFPEIERAVLFGSRATGAWTASSDIDLALHGDAITLEIEHRLAAFLDDLLLPVPIDLVRVRALRSQSLLRRIAAEGVAFYAR
jgi:predicted nucleotidyltransferase